MKLLVVAIALLLGAQSINAQQTGIWTPLPVSQMHGPVECRILDIDLYHKGSCLVVERLLKGKQLSFGPTPEVMTDIVFICEKGLDGFMDERYRGAIQEMREAYFRTTDGFDCFKRINSAGVEQATGPWAGEQHDELAGEAMRPKQVFGAGVTNGPRKGAATHVSFTTRGARPLTFERR